MNTKNYRFRIKSTDDATGEFTGYAAVFGNVDLQNEVVEPGAFSKTLAEQKDFPILWQHNADQPIGVTVSAVEDDKGLAVRGQINLETQTGREVYALLKQGAVKGISFGYDVIKDIVKNGVRRLLELKLWELSLVTFPANPAAQVLAVKSAVPVHRPPLSGSDTWDADEAERRLRAWATEDGEINWDRYQLGFAWYDKENFDTLGAYKLPHHDIEGGELVTVWRGVVAAAAALVGGRGGVDIPRDDIGAVKEHLAVHYNQFDQSPPWAESENSDGTQEDEILEPQEDDEITQLDQNNDLDEPKNIEAILSGIDQILAEIEDKLKSLSERL